VIVDAHVHLLPGRLAEKVRAFFAAHMATEHREHERPFAYPIDHAAVLTSMAADGVDQVWSFSYAHKPGIAAGLNEAAATTAAAFSSGPVEVVGGGTVHPGDDDPAALAVDAVDRLGLRVLKLHCSVGAFDVDDRRLDPVFAVAAERLLPVVVHLGHDVSGHTEASELAALDRVANAHPEAPIVLAHSGHHAAREALAVLDAHPSLFADLTPVGSSPVGLAADDIARRPERFLFGSDAPNTPFTVSESLARVRALGLPPDVEAAVLGGNAQRLSAGVQAG
jgi:predicted TIM-barrel fold metal-dependent hydrolase